MYPGRRFLSNCVIDPFISDSWVIRQSLACRLRLVDHSLRYERRSLLPVLANRIGGREKRSNPAHFHLCAVTFDSACLRDSVHRQWAHFYGLFAEPTVLNLIANPLAGRKCAKLDSAQGGFSKRHLCSVVAANHAFLLVSIDVPDHTFHASDSCLFPKAKTKSLSFVKGEGAGAIRSQGAPQPTRPLAELHHTEPTYSCRKRAFRVLRCLGSPAGSRLHINSNR